MSDFQCLMMEPEDSTHCRATKKHERQMRAVEPPQPPSACTRAPAAPGGTRTTYGVRLSSSAHLIFRSYTLQGLELRIGIRMWIRFGFRIGIGMRMGWEWRSGSGSECIRRQDPVGNDIRMMIEIEIKI
ncbi:hypothetical protein EVAR_528_1 [Eumeta japonica]|uniref:Uncharacterized protein n=1 Tax=Eumeta variegata TaxID=151549 RepID=A0A4C1SCY7_EUMVA|nr:hypothetical protein EVAR_528_1 [Eumeta japonica]